MGDKYLSVRVPREKHMEVSKAVLERGTSLTSVVSELLDDWLGRAPDTTLTKREREATDALLRLMRDDSDSAEIASL